MGLLFCSKLSAALRNSLARGVVLAGIVTTTATGVGAGLEQQRKLDSLEQGAVDSPASSVSADQPGDPAGDASALLEEMGVVSAPQTTSQTAKNPNTALPRAELLSAPAEAVSPEEITPPVMAAMEQFNEMDDLLSAAERRETLEEDAAAKQGTPPTEAPPPDPPPRETPGEERQDIAFQGDVWENPACGNGGGNQYFIPHAKELKENTLEGNPGGGRLVALEREFETPGEARPSAPGEGVRSFQQDGRHVQVDGRPLTQEEAAEFAQMENSLPETLSAPLPQASANPELLSPEEIRELEASTIDTRGLNRIQGDVRQEDYLRPHSNQEDGGFLPDGWKNPTDLQDGQVFYQLSVDGDTPSSYFTDEKTVNGCRREDGTVDFNKLRDQLQVKDGMDKGCLTKYVYQAPQAQQMDPPRRDQDLDGSPPEHRQDAPENTQPPGEARLPAQDPTEDASASQQYSAGDQALPQEAPENGKSDIEKQEGPETPSEALPEEHGEDPSEEARDETREDSFDQGETSDQEKVSDQEEASDQEETTGEEKISNREETANQEETADQENASDQEEAPDQKEGSAREETFDQEETAGQEETANQEEAPDQEETADQEENPDQKETTQEVENPSWEKPPAEQDAQSQENAGEAQDVPGQDSHPWQRSSAQEETSDREEAAGQGKTADQEKSSDQGEISAQKGAPDQQETAGWEKGADQEETTDQEAAAQEAESPTWEKLPSEKQGTQESSAEDPHPWQRPSDQEETADQEEGSRQEDSPGQEEASAQKEDASREESSHQGASAGDTSQSADNERGYEY